ncbi:MAG: GNAT family N-acetyltransferase [Gemmiger sp.]
MEYYRQILLKNGKTAVLRSGGEADGAAVLENFNRTHAETEYLLSYPDENSLDAEKEGQYLAQKTKSEREIEIIALVDGQVAGTAGIDALGTAYKVRHRAEFGVGVLREYWGLGIGRALLEACLHCARQAGYTQVELTVVSQNERAVALYQQAGFVEFGRNPRGFRCRSGEFQELVSMRLELPPEAGSAPAPAL